MTAFTIEYDIDEPAEVHSWWVAPGIRRLVGATPDEWVADRGSWAQHLHPDDRERAVAEWEAAIGPGSLATCSTDSCTGTVTSCGSASRRPWRSATAACGRTACSSTSPRRWRPRRRSDKPRPGTSPWSSSFRSPSTPMRSTTCPTALYVSPRYEQLTGYTPRATARRPAALGSDAASGRSLPCARRIGTDEPERRTVRCRVPDRVVHREIVWLHDHAVLVVGADGRRVWQGVLQDVTERRRAQEALSRRDAILQSAGFAAEQLLGSSSWEEALPAVLARLGAARRGLARVPLPQRDEVEDMHIGRARGRLVRPGRRGNGSRRAGARFAWQRLRLRTLDGPSSVEDRSCTDRSRPSPKREREPP